MELREYAQILRRRWIVIALAAALGVLAAIGVTVATPKTYEATTRSAVNLARPLGDSRDLQQGSQFAISRIKTYTAFAQSPDVLRPVIDKLDLDTSWQDLATHVSAEGPVDTALLDVTVDDTSAKRAADIANAVTRQLVDYIVAFETPPGSRTSDVAVDVVRPAVAPTAPASPKPVLNLVLGLFAGLAAGVVLALLREQYDTKLKTPDHLLELSGASPLAVVGVVAKADRKPLVALDQHSHHSEAYRTLRSNLAFADVDEAPRSIVVSSSSVGEGKTTVACNLAIVLAQAGLRVCLVDADLRRPSVASLLGIEGAVGLTNVLAGQYELRAALRSWRGGLLTVLPAGTTPPDPGSLLGSKHMTETLRELATLFDRIVVDTPPLLAVTDAAVVAREVDGAVVVARHGRTDREQLRRALDGLRRAGARLLGTVLVAVPRHDPAAPMHYRSEQAESEPGVVPPATAAPMAVRGSAGAPPDEAADQGLDRS